MIILITGTRKGIGYNLAKRYLSEGHFVIGCSRNECDIEDKDYCHYLVDITNEKDVNGFVSEIKAKFNHVDVLINNAGAAAMNHFLFTPVETAKSIMELNYIGSFICARAFVNLLKKSDHPRIINFTTVAVPLNLAGELAYVASKSAIESFTKVLSKELAHLKITVNAIGPGPTETDLIGRIPKAKIDDLINNQTIKRMGTFADIANVIDFFISPGSDFITGQIIYLGGICK